MKQTKDLARPPASLVARVETVVKVAEAVGGAVVVEPTPAHEADYGNQWTRVTSQMPFPELSVGGLQYQRNFRGGGGGGGGGRSGIGTRMMNVNDEDDEDDTINGDGGGGGGGGGDDDGGGSGDEAVAVEATEEETPVCSPSATPTRSNFGAPLPSAGNAAAPPTITVDANDDDGGGGGGIDDGDLKEKENQDQEPPHAPTLQDVHTSTSSNA